MHWFWLEGAWDGRVWLSCILQSVSGRFLSRVPGCKMWTLEYLATQSVTHIALPPNIWIEAVLLVTTHGKQNLVKWELRQTWHCSWLARCSFVQSCTITIIPLSVSSWHRPPPDKHYTPATCTLVPHCSLIRIACQTTLLVSACFYKYSGKRSCC